jgi:hypothetical protein
MTIYQLFCSKLFVCVKNVNKSYTYCAYFGFFGLSILGNKTQRLIISTNKETKKTVAISQLHVSERIPAFSL